MFTFSILLLYFHILLILDLKFVIFMVILSKNYKQTMSLYIFPYRKYSYRRY